MKIIKGKSCQKCNSTSVYLDCELERWYEHCLICGFTTLLEELEPVKGDEKSWSGKMPERPSRTLYECLHARVLDSRIYCSKGYRLSKVSEDGSIGIDRLAEGMNLANPACRCCPDFECMGSPLRADEKGWLMQGCCEENRQ